MYRHALKIFLNKDDVKMSAKCMNYFFAEVLQTPAKFSHKYNSTPTVIF